MFTQKDEFLEISDQTLIHQFLEGNKKSLEKLIKRHQDYIYTISLKLFFNHDDALDATQEILIKIITRLKSFKGKSSFKTWLYRIAVNHFLNSPKKKMEIILSQNSSSFAGFSEISQEEEAKISQEELEEMRVMCSTAMLMCLDREQRLLYIIGEIFGADHNLGAELFEITPSNYRVKLHRAKTDLLRFVSGKCGLVNQKNPCRCNKKTKMMIEKGFIDKNDRNKMSFTSDFEQKVNQIVSLKKDEISDTIQFKMLHLFRDSPFQVKEELDNLISEISVEVV